MDSPRADESMLAWDRHWDDGSGQGEHNASAAGYAVCSSGGIITVYLSEYISFTSDKVNTFHLPPTKEEVNVFA